MFKRVFERFKPKPKVEKPKEEPKIEAKKIEAKTEELSESQLVRIFTDLKKYPELLDLIVKNVFDESGDEFESVETIRDKIINIATPAEALHFAKLIDKTLGEGTFRKISFISRGVDAERNVKKILQKDIRNKSFERRAEKGLYLNIKEDYGVEWSLEKTARDIWQNFFDGNNQTLDGINMSISTEKINGKKVAKVKISGLKEYDWRELVHLGGTTKKESKTTAGGFGEGTKVLSLVLLRDYGAKDIRFSSNNWELEFYLDRVPRGSYGKEEDRGLFAKKKSTGPESGNKFELTFTGDKAEEEATAVKTGRNLFYSSENIDFQNPTFNNKDGGGFRVLPPIKGKYSVQGQKGHLYVAGQRMHYDSRDKWDTVEYVNIWAWQKFLPKDRDRGLITRSELEDGIIPPIVEVMDIDEASKSVFEFKPLWDKLSMYEAGYKLLKKIVEKLAKNGVKLKFEREYLAGDLPWNLQWISDLLEQQGYKICVGFLSEAGMTKVSERFKELQSHNRVEATPQEKEKIDLLKKASQTIGFGSEDLKDVWIFSGEAEKSIFHGQYNDMFFWMAKEALRGRFLDALETYIHEAAHKAGPHGNPQFEYTLQEYLKKIKVFILDKTDEFKKLESDWMAISSN